MASAWAKAWGKSWGNAWGAIAIAIPPASGGKKPPAAEWQWPPFQVFDDDAARRMKRRENEILFLGK